MSPFYFPALHGCLVPPKGLWIGCLQRVQPREHRAVRRTGARRTQLCLVGAQRGTHGFLTIWHRLETGSWGFLGIRTSVCPDPGRGKPLTLGVARAPVEVRGRGSRCGCGQVVKGSGRPPEGQGC